jgi:predicted benzoate:H+ symporter BenE
VKLRSFEFNLRELAGATGDFGTLFPLAIGYIAVCGLNPAGMLVMMGLANVATGLAYRLPMPIEPMKVLAVVAISQAWSPSLVSASALGMGIVWLLLASTGVMGWIARVTPHSVVRGIQIALGLLLAIPALKMLSTGWLLGLISVAVVLLFRKSRYAPAALVLILLGITIMAIQGHLTRVQPPAFSLPAFAVPRMEEVWQGLLLAGFAQLPLTATNAVISTSSLISTYWPERTVKERQLAWSTGAMNLVASFLGGMPMCHGAGGLAGQYYFGARTGGTNLMEGAIEIILGLFFASSIAHLFGTFPQAIVGAMMLLVGLELVKFAGDVRWGRNLVPMAITVAVSVPTNMAFGFLAGLVSHYLLEFYERRGRREPALDRR